MCWGVSSRYGAVLILRQLAANAPTVFNVHVPAFIDAIWPALRCGGGASHRAPCTLQRSFTLA